MGDDSSVVVATCMFRGNEYVVTMNTSRGNVLVVEVEDRLTADQWRGSFDAAYLEDLTHKTGNYKQFCVFTSMLESALIQSSDSVSLDLLTFADLESLKNSKPGTGTRTIPANRANTLGSKRYLILTYTVEFDRIHYPLPLPYVGKPDPHTLQETIARLRKELKSSKQQASKDYKNKEMQKLKKDYERLLREKEYIESEFIDYKREMQNTEKGNTAKQIRILKNIIQTLEEDLIKEKAKYTRAANKRNQENKKLLDEVDELRASQRNLQVRVKSLTNELVLFKRRGYRTTTNTSGSSVRDTSGRSRLSGSSVRDTSGRSRVYTNGTSSRDNSFSRNISRHSDLSRDRSRNIRNRSLSSERNYSRDRTYERNRSLSRDRSASRDRGRSASLERPQDRSTDRSRSSFAFRSRDNSPSPSGARYPRFDPTAYIKDQERKKNEVQRKHRPRTKSRLSESVEKKTRPSSAASDRSAGRGRSISRASSVGSLASRNSSVEYFSDIGIDSDSSQGRIRKSEQTLKPVKSKSSNGWLGPDKPHPGFPRSSSKSKKILSSTPEESKRVRSRIKKNKENEMPSEAAESDYFDRSVEISEIDARLNRLQQFMKSNLS